jgi:phosphohistidine phosphatase
MKTIYINRHAKSDWPDKDMTDFDRPLNRRGLKDAPVMATRLAERLRANGDIIDHIVSSTAKRAITTCDIFCEVNGWGLEKVEKTRDIYENGSMAVKKIISAMDSNINSVIFFGHNPHFSDLVTYFSGNQGVQLPTCGIVRIDFNTDKWADLLEVNGNINFFDYPKNND